MADADSEPGKLLTDMMAAGARQWLQFARTYHPAAADPAPLASYLEYTRQLVEMQANYFLQYRVEAAPADEKTQGLLRFAARQYADALSPANFLATNPEALQLAQETGGQSLVEGMSLFFQDLAKGRVSMTDEAAFEVGRNVAVTEGAVVFENELMQLIQYAPRTAEVYNCPLLIVPPCINKYYILDLQPENSFVRYAVDQGHTVFLISWRNIAPEFGHLTWDDYLQQGVLRALDIARAVCDVPQLNTLGFCVGGTLLASALALRSAQPQCGECSMTLLTALLDFSDTGELGLLVSEPSVAARELAIGRGGVMPGKELALVFSSLRANDLIWQYVVNSYLKGKAPPAFDLLAWNSDATNLPGPMFCWYIRNTYLENRLRLPGGTTQCGQAVDLSTIRLPTYLYASIEDHIVPWRSAYASVQLLGDQCTFALGASGHIAGVINPPARNKRHFWIEGTLNANPDAWLKTARQVPGSWWVQWNSWLSERSGGLQPARTLLGNQQYAPIEPAPGRYVRATAP
jgi:polyhydroxyalkanoate synthase